MHKSDLIQRYGEKIRVAEAVRRIRRYDHGERPDHHLAASGYLARGYRPLCQAVERLAGAG